MGAVCIGFSFSFEFWADRQDGLRGPAKINYRLLRRVVRGKQFVLSLSFSSSSLLSHSTLSFNFFCKFLFSLVDYPNGY